MMTATQMAPRDTLAPASSRNHRNGEPSAWVEGLLVGGGLVLLFLTQYWHLALH
jgi:hypothetical protein